jgi:CheY-like chemotaxis protein
LQNTTLLRETELQLVHDIQKRKLIEESLKTAVADADKANTAKGQFLANMSHEIRTPMHIIMGIAQILEESPLNDDQKKQVNMFKKAGNNLLNIINDILDISKIESGNLIIKNTKININNILEDIVDLCMPKALAKNLDLTFKINNNVPIEFIGDDTRIKQILINLVSNAIKFTDKGAVTINIETNIDSTKKGNIYFSVADTGIGISPEDSQRLFQPFSQAHSSMTKSYGGTGLGLAISKRLVELMGGEIWLSSKEALGSTFFFTLTCEIINNYPCRAPSAPSYYENPSADFRNKSQIIKSEESASPEIATSPNEVSALKILLVDDLEENRILLKAFLKNTRHKITEAENGAIAVEKVKHESFDIILMDMQMPVLDGYSATQQIRNWEQLNNLPRIPIIALTAYALAEERAKSVAAGCDNHMTKPIKKADLLKMLNEFSFNNSTKTDLTI